jgi:hypothetical protein
MLKLKKIAVTMSLFTVTSVTLFTSFEANALPSFSRQTGASCNQCHTQSFGPNLTPFGRDFKLGGYTMSNGKSSNIPAVSALVSGSFTNTKADQEPVPGYNKNNNFTFDSASLFYAGKIYGKVGAFSELKYNGVAEKLALDNTDIRFADNMDIMNTPVTYGISVNNNPTAQDLWNTSAWGFPYSGTDLQPGGIGSSALIDDGGLAANVGGATAYTMINNLLYLEAGGYTSLSNGIQKGIGISTPDRNGIDGAAPYWRVALQKDWKGHFFAVGHYGMMADVFPGRDRIGATNRYTDIAFDATYQYMANPKHIFEVKSTYIYEDQKLSYDRIGNGLNPNAKSYLNTFKFNTSYTFDQTYGVTFAYNNIKGSNVLTPNVDVAGTYDLSKPNTDYYTAELVYIPFGKSASYMAPWLNLRTSLQYIGYAKVNGATQQSSGNNTFMINGQLAF